MGYGKEKHRLQKKENGITIYNIKTERKIGDVRFSHRLACATIKESQKRTKIKKTKGH